MPAGPRPWQPGHVSCCPHGRSRLGAPYQVRKRAISGTPPEIALKKASQIGATRDPESRPSPAGRTRPSSSHAEVYSTIAAESNGKRVPGLGQSSRAGKRAVADGGRQGPQPGCRPSVGQELCDFRHPIGLSTTTAPPDAVRGGSPDPPRRRCPAAARKRMRAAGQETRRAMWRCSTRVGPMDPTCGAPQLAA